MNCPYCKKILNMEEVGEVTETDCPHCGKCIRLLPAKAIKTDETTSVTILEPHFNLKHAIALANDLIDSLIDLREKLKKHTIKIG